MMKILSIVLLATLALPAHSFTDDSLTGEPCATRLNSRYVEQVTVKTPTRRMENGSDDTTK